MKEMRHFFSTVDSCESAISKAETDHNKGEFKMYFSSGFDAYENKFPFTFYKRIEEQYGIEIIYTGDVGHPYFSCYNLKMDSLLIEKIGYKTIENLYKAMHREQYPD
ncbi:hypothetical protein H9Q13_14815 [Pontibacter sp. JH31]|uniref:Uncharacterized protein n=1 Tax=Pontibacter aquaedesilientis TaxID=2766980 RepID=A0ABR7XLY0_9BACT|nr:hypothetical protein [Pontibacter aquaedesilientis]MBD1398441.1 hypothetical protein [Pontibacter aquaedesilientis]